ncbi:MAG: NTP transferase domain-containing protein [Bacteroidales bacterium]|nr:NTP transferase domain-containing protein [Bacteroidales bacterium]
MEALILAGGLGTRLKPFTTIIPKPLMPIGNMPILEVVIKQLAKFGFKKIYLSVNYLAELIGTFFKDGKKFGVKIEYLFEEKPLGTMGPLKLIKKFPRNLLIINGDTLTDLNYSNFFNFHIDNKSLLTISSFARTVKIDFGVLRKNKINNEINGFTEKPIIKYLVCMGVNAVNQKILEFIPENESFGFDALVKKLLKNKIKALTYLHEGYWLDIGRHEDYEKANEEFCINKFI